MRSSTAGFTFIEIIVALAIVSVLALALIPAYNTYIVRSRRSDAVKSLMQYQVAQEKYRINNTSYATAASALGFTNTNSIDGYYTMAITTSSSSTYTLTATANTSGGQTADTGCTTLTITYANGTATNTPTNCWQ